MASSLLSLLGVVVGTTAGWFGGPAEAALMRLVDLMLCFPALFLLLIVFALLAATPEIIVLYLSLFAWLHLARVVHSEFFLLREQELVQGARAAGVGSRTHRFAGIAQTVGAGDSERGAVLPWGERQAAASPAR